MFFLALENKRNQNVDHSDWCSTLIRFAHWMQLQMRVGVGGCTRLLVASEERKKAHNLAGCIGKENSKTHPCKQIYLFNDILCSLRRESWGATIWHGKVRHLGRVCVCVCWHILYCTRIYHPPQSETVLFSSTVRMPDAFHFLSIPSRTLSNGMGRTRDTNACTRRRCLLHIFHGRISP